MPKILLLLAMLWVCDVVHAQQPLRVVTDPWPPFAYQENGKAVGLDVETSLAVFARMGMEVRIEFLPWARCLSMMENTEADAILSLSVTPERKEFLYFPDEPLSLTETVFFKRRGGPVHRIDLNDAKSLRLGAIIGYEYCPMLDNTPLVNGAVRLKSLDQSFKMLLRDRLDLVIAVDAVGIHKAEKMGIMDRLDILSPQEYCIDGNHIAFSKKAGYGHLTEEFSIALQKFKATRAYENILRKYGLHLQ